MEFPPKIVVNLANEISNAITAPGAKSRSAAAQNVASRYFDKIVRETTATMACKAGCYYCCSIPVAAWPTEIFAIAEYAREQKKHKMLGNVDRFAEKLRKAAAEGQESRYQKRKLCPFLFDSRCSIYALRPLTCRAVIVPDVDGCVRHFKGSEENASCYAVPKAAQVIHSGAIILAGANLGLDMRHYWFIDAMAHVLTNGLTEDLFFNREDPFSGVPENAIATKEEVMASTVGAAAFLAKGKLAY